MRCRTGPLACLSLYSICLVDKGRCLNLEFGFYLSCSLKDSKSEGLKCYRHLRLQNWCFHSECVFESNSQCYYSMKYWRNWWHKYPFYGVLNNWQQGFHCIEKMIKFIIYYRTQQKYPSNSYWYWFSECSIPIFKDQMVHPEWCIPTSKRVLSWSKWYFSVFYIYFRQNKEKRAKNEHW